MIWRDEITCGIYWQKKKWGGLCHSRWDSMSNSEKRKIKEKKYKENLRKADSERKEKTVMAESDILNY